jgi:hypothetical protein
VGTSFKSAETTRLPCTLYYTHPIRYSNNRVDVQRELVFRWHGNWYSRAKGSSETAPTGAVLVREQNKKEKQEEGS